METMKAMMATMMGTSMAHTPNSGLGPEFRTDWLGPRNFNSLFSLYVYLHLFSIEKDLHYKYIN